MDPEKSIIVVGAGVFGLSTALELKNRGYRSVTILDRFIPPVPDGSSVDISRIIRVDYADPLYGRMAQEAYSLWKTAYKSHYHESGFVIYADKSGNDYMEKAKKVNEDLGNKVDYCENAHDIRKVYPDIKSDLDGLRAMHNPKGGWADAAGAIGQLARQCSTAGVSFVTGARGTVTSFLYKEGRLVGLDTVGGERIMVSQIILATGAWTNRILQAEHATTASGQQVGFIELSDVEAAQMGKMPVMINLATGFFVFPPTPVTNILKIARHGYGFATEETLASDQRIISGPKLAENNASSGYIPEDAEAALRQGLRQLVPWAADHEWTNRRLCWYSDTPEGDFIIDYHPQIDGLFLATGGSGQYVLAQLFTV